MSPSLLWMTLWPGLARLWLRGHLRGVFQALLFGLAVQLALITTFVWPQLLTRQVPGWVTPSAAWVLVLWLWVTGVREGTRILTTTGSGPPPDDEWSKEAFRQAQLEYLQGNWSEVETLLRRLIRRRPADPEAQLLLATTYRRQDRPAEARQTLEELLAQPGSARWLREIEAELRRLPEKPSPAAPDKNQLSTNPPRREAA